MSNHDRRRKHLRFQSDIDWVAYIDSQPEMDTFEKEVSALPITESRGGCMLALRSDIAQQLNLGVDTKLRIQVGQLSPCLGTVRWIKQYDDLLSTIGVEYEGAEQV